MARHPSPFASPAEFALLESIWSNDTRTVRELVNEHYPDGTPSDLATVQKLLKRLEDKGLIKRNRGVAPQVVSPAHSRKELAKREAAALAKKYGMKPAELAKL